jgi:hypothetical protein
VLNLATRQVTPELSQANQQHISRTLESVCQRYDFRQLFYLMYKIYSENMRNFALLQRYFITKQPSFSFKFQ